MSDDTPAVPGPAGSEEPVTATPVEEPTAPSAGAPAPTPPETAEATPAGTPEPAEAAEDAEAPTEAAEAPTQVAAADGAAEVPAADAETPTEAAEVPAAAAAAPVAGAPAPVASADRGRGVFVPVWVAAVVGVLVVAGLGFLIGWIAAPGDDASPSNAVATAPNGESIPNLPVFPGNGNQNGNGTQNGNGSNGSNDDSSDSTPSVPSQSRAYLGVSLDPSADDGPTIASVQAGGPAAKAGLQAGDVITKVDGDAVETPLDAVQAIREHDPGDTVTITYTRNGSTSDVKVTLATTPTTQSAS